MERKVLTVSFLLKDGAVLLGMKKTGFGKGNWNGFGGKVEEGETLSHAAVREIQEEAGVLVEEKSLEKVAILEFHHVPGAKSIILEVHVFLVSKWIGEPTESDEMRPEWFGTTEIPYDSMWVDDVEWLPKVLSGERFSAKIWFEKEGDEVEKIEWGEL